MSAKLPSYPTYKDSGVKWLGDLPKHWDTAVLKRMAHTELSNIDKKTAEDETSIKLCNYLDVYRNQTITADLDFMVASASKEQIVRLALRRGDVIITKDSETPDDIGVPALVADHMAGVVCGYHLALLRAYPRVTCASYLACALRSISLRAQFSTSAVGITRFALGKYKIENAILPKPPIEEQTKIAEFLDIETGKIDALIVEQRRLIELLREKRPAIISHAVTKGLSPEVSMKESGIDWLGRVPRHWDVARLAYFATVENGATPSRDDIQYWTNGQIPWLASGEVNQLRINEAGECITQRALRDCSLRILPIGTVVVGLVGQGKTRGMSAILCIPAAINQNLAAVCPGSRLSSEYLLNVFQAAYTSLREDGRGGNQAAMNCKMLASLRIPVPPKHEQTEIAAFIDSSLARIDALEKQSTSSIELLQERRSALVSAAVTGRMDVRNYRPQEVTAVCQ